jgi:hypothetical protein
VTAAAAARKEGSGAVAGERRSPDASALFLGRSRTPAEIQEFHGRDRRQGLESGRVGWKMNGMKNGRGVCVGAWRNVLSGRRDRVVACLLAAQAVGAVRGRAGSLGPGRFAL